MSDERKVSYQRIYVGRRRSAGLFLYIPVYGEWDRQDFMQHESDVWILVGSRFPMSASTDVRDVDAILMIEENTSPTPHVVSDLPLSGVRTDWHEVYLLCSRNLDLINGAPIEKEQPQHPHGCHSCVHICSDEVYDTYLCPQAITPPSMLGWRYSLLRRFGSLDKEYSSRDVHENTHLNNPTAFLAFFSMCEHNANLHRRKNDIQANLATHE